jgi:uncharacterized protein YbbC (DUF1343 family)
MTHPGVNDGFDYGLEAFFRDPSVKGRVGLVTNATGRDRHGVHTADRIARHERLQLAAIFTPEHGFGADAPDGEPVLGSFHAELGVPLISLYGPRKTPTGEELRDLDLLVYDIQDVGVRFYTYISTLRNCLTAAFEAGLPFHVLDRPDLLGGEIVEGPDLDPAYSSFLGHLPLPLRYGLTPGELALWWRERLPQNGTLVIWECRNLHRGVPFEALGVPWRQLSPSMCTPDTARFYPGTCLFEGLNIAEGRGSAAPFQILGAPEINPEAWIAELAPLLPPQVTVASTTFCPTFAKFEGRLCRGIHLETRAAILPDAVKVGIMAIAALQKSHPGLVAFTAREGFEKPFFDYLAGNAWLREHLIKGAPLAEIFSRLDAEALPFRRAKTNFHRYSAPGAHCSAAATASGTKAK